MKKSKVAPPKPDLTPPPASGDIRFPKPKTFGALVDTLRALAAYGGLVPVSFLKADQDYGTKIAKTAETARSVFGTREDWDLFNHYVPPAWLPPRYFTPCGSDEHGFVSKLNDSSMDEIAEGMKTQWGLGLGSRPAVELHKMACAVLEELFLRAQEEKTAVEALASIANLSTTRLHSLSVEDLREVAGTHPSFPISCCPHPKAWREVICRLKHLRVSEDCPLNFRAGSRWNPKKPATVIASLLLDFLISYRALGVWASRMAGDGIEPMLGFSDFGYFFDPHDLVYAAAKLPDLSEESVDKWWDLANRALTDVCPDLHKIPQLKKIVTEKGALKGTQNTRIRGSIADTFKSLVAG